jgi:gluconokinase
MCFTLTGASLHRFDPPLKIVVMGVSGCGKTTVGMALAARLGAAFFDGDDLHPAENIAKMSRGEPLTDDDRWPWLTKVADVLQGDGPRIVGCSALKRAYRDHIRQVADGPVVFVHLVGTRAVIAARMRVRAGHFMPPALLDSQFATLEPPGVDEAAVTVDIDQPSEAVIEAILSGVQQRSGTPP